MLPLAKEEEVEGRMEVGRRGRETGKEEGREKRDA